MSGGVSVKKLWKIVGITFLLGSVLVSPILGEELNKNMNDSFLGYMNEDKLYHSYGTLYYHKAGEERQLIAEDVDEGQYYLSRKSQVILYCSGKDLYWTRPGQEPIMIAENVVVEGFVADERMVHYSKIGERGEYYYDIEKRKSECIGNDEAIEIDYERGYYYVFSSGGELQKISIFATESNQEITVISENVFDCFKLDKDTYFYVTQNGDELRYYIYNEANERSRPIQINEEMSLGYSRNSINLMSNRKSLLCYGLNASDNKRLFIIGPNNKTQLLVDGIESYIFCKEEDKVYYLKGESLYLLELNKEREYAIISNEVITNNVDYYLTSNNGNNLVVEDAMNNVYFIQNGEVKNLGNELRGKGVVDDYFFYETKDNDLFVLRDIKKKPQLLTDACGGVITCDLEEAYFVYCSLEVLPNGQLKGVINMYEKDGTNKVLLEDIGQVSSFYWSSGETYESMQTMEDFVGHYAIYSDSYWRGDLRLYIVQVGEDGTVTVYEGNKKLYTKKYSLIDVAGDRQFLLREQEQQMLGETMLENTSVRIISNGLESDIKITREQLGWYSVSLKDKNEAYYLYLLTDSEFKGIIEGKYQIAVEEAKEALGAKERPIIDKLDYMAKSYQNGGVKLTQGHKYYSEPNYGSPINAVIAEEYEVLVVDYEIDFKNRIIWVKVVVDINGIQRVWYPVVVKDIAG